MPRAAAAATSGVEFHFIGGTWGHIVSTMMFHSLFCTVQVRIKVNVTNLVEKRGWRYNVWHQKMFWIIKYSPFTCRITIADEKNTTDVASRPPPTADQPLTSIFVCACSLSFRTIFVSPSLVYTVALTTLYLAPFCLLSALDLHSQHHTSPPRATGIYTREIKLVRNTWSSLILVGEHNILVWYTAMTITLIFWSRPYRWSIFEISL